MTSMVMGTSLKIDLKLFRVCIMSCVNSSDPVSLRIIDVDEFKTFVALGLKGSEEDKLRGTVTFHHFQHCYA